MVFLILESLGSTELLFILVMALVFFGPRKLPQLSRTLGKNLATFRKASEDFKQTWEKEVSLEELNMSLDLEPTRTSNPALDQGTYGHSAAPTIGAVDAGQVVPRQSGAVDQADYDSSDSVEQPQRKRDWL